MVVRLEGTKDISCIVEKLIALNYDVVSHDKKIAFLYRKSSNSNELKTDIKAAKTACTFIGTIKAIYGTNTTSV